MHHFCDFVTLVVFFNACQLDVVLLPNHMDQGDSKVQGALGVSIS